MANAFAVAAPIPELAPVMTEYLWFCLVMMREILLV